MHTPPPDHLQKHRGQTAFWRLADAMQRFVYWGGWPARLWRRLSSAPLVRVAEHRIEVRGTWRADRPLQVAFASDFHAGPTTDSETLRRACQLLSEARPDVLMLGGDFVSLGHTEVGWLAGLLGEIPAPLGRYAVLGNHDNWNGPAYIVRALEDAGITVLANQNRRLAAPFDDVWVCGLDDFISGIPRVRQALAGADGRRIVLMHAPANLVDLDGERFDLALCGHTHGGQIALPGGHPLLVAPGPLSRRYNRGRHDLAAGNTLLVTVGLGCTTLPFRVNAEPEIFLVTIGPTRSESSPRLPPERETDTTGETR